MYATSRHITGPSDRNLDSNNFTVAPPSIAELTGLLQLYVVLNVTFIRW